jgi:L,D-peptidoglycan transpeptidase YkuD (ErfK/YbiS/YcfS/YnhG family)
MTMPFSIPPALRAADFLLLVVAPDWSASAGRLQAFRRGSNAAPWLAVGAPLPVTLGRAGLAPGGGLLADWGAALPPKREGDGCSPAGLFPVTGLFGYAMAGEAAERADGLAYRRATADLKCIDDPASRYYNQLVDERRFGRIDWTSAEDMRRDDGRYEFGAIVGCNCDPVVAGAGSCIFLHVWAGESVPTAGCTAMARADMMRVVDWLAGACSPVLVQLPEAAFANFRDPWGLPDFTSRSAA